MKQFSSKDITIEEIKTLRSLLEQYIYNLSPIPTNTIENKKRFNKRVKIVLFDIYGTLLISEAGEINTDINIIKRGEEREYITPSLQSLEKKIDLPTVLREEIIRTHTLLRKEGIDYPEIDIITIWHTITQKFLEKKLSLTEIMRIATEYELINNKISLMPQAKETLKELKERGLTLGIVSNAQFYTPVILSFLLEQPLEEIFSSNFLVWSFQERRGKPSPLIFKKISESMRDYQIPIELSLYVGNDMKNDIFTAHANGIPTVLFQVINALYG